MIQHTLNLLTTLTNFLISSITRVSAFSFVLITINLVLLWRLKQRNFKKLKLRFGLPVPEISHPFFGHLNEMSSRFKELKWHKELGAIFGLYNCDTPAIKIADVNLVNEVFFKQTKVFNARVLREFRLQVIKDTILFNKGNSWKKIRKIIQPALAEYRVKQNESATTIRDIQSGIDALIGRFKSLTRCPHSDAIPIDDKAGLEYNEKGFAPMEDSGSPTGWALHMNTYAVMQVITLDVIHRLAFNLNDIDITKGASDPSLKLIRYLQDSVQSLRYKIALAVPLSRLVLIPWMIFFDPAIKAYKQIVSGILDNVVADWDQRTRKAKEGEGTEPRRIYDVLLQEYQAGNLSRLEVKSNIMAILIAGYETTATTSTYILWCVARYDSCRERLRSDILNYGIESKYLDMFVKEAMRMYPALPNFVIRTAHEDTKLAGYEIKRGTSIHMSVNTIHYDESIWPNPNVFQPERFAGGKTYPPGAYAPFGLGHRMCAGYQLALREMKTIVCEFLTNFDIQLVAPAEMTVESASIYLTRPKHEVRLKLVPILEAPGRKRAGSSVPVDSALSENGLSSESPAESN